VRNVANKMRATHFCANINCVCHVEMRMQKIVSETAIVDIY